MSLLQNPNFESGSFSLPWKKINFPNNVIVNVGSSVGPPPYSGSNVAFVVSQANGGSIGQDVTGVDAPHVTELRVIAGNRTLAGARLQCQRERIVGRVIDRERPELLDMAIVRRICAVALIVDEAAVVVAGEVFIGPELALHRLGNDDAIDRVRQRCEVGAACIELHRADFSRGERCRVPESAEPGARRHVEVAGEERPAALRLMIDSGGVPLRPAIGRVHEKIHE